MRDDQNLITVTVNGTDLGVFDTCDGGDMDSNDLLYRPGGMGPQVSLGGMNFLTAITVGRLYDLARDTDAMRFCLPLAGKGQVVINKQPLDTDKNPFGRPYVYRGTLKTVTVPKVDSNATGVASVWTMVVTAEGAIG